MAIVVGVFVAVAGWLVNAYFARRAVRRNLRIEYLLSAYRRLEHASNRDMTEAHDAALEGAVSDIQLLGSPQQVELATTFARAFAADQRADTEPLLEDLRASLRRELQLEPVPPQRMWLRISRSLERGSGPEVSDQSWAVWQQQLVEVETNMRAARGGEVTRPWHIDQQPDLSGASPFVREMLELAHRTPIGAVAACEQRIAARLREVLEANLQGDISGLNMTDLAKVARERGLINDATRNGIDGLGVMHTMALLEDGGLRLEERRAREYIALTEGVLLALRLPPP
jgi:hypothetical protein